MSKKPKKFYILNREKYKTVKKFDHNQMEVFCSDIYMSGYKDGKNSVPGMDISKIYEAIAGVKGIGPKKLEEIKCAVDKAMEGEKHE